MFICDIRSEIIIPGIRTVNEQLFIVDIIPDRCIFLSSFTNLKTKLSCFGVGKIKLCNHFKCIVRKVG
ncbi:hypothetical protein D1872_215280 [compost metagenome]